MELFNFINCENKKDLFNVIYVIEWNVINGMKKYGVLWYLYFF